jgi:hypothetical protein
MIEDGCSGGLLECTEHFWYQFGSSYDLATLARERSGSLQAAVSDGYGQASLLSTTVTQSPAGAGQGEGGSGAGPGAGAGSEGKSSGGSGQPAPASAMPLVASLGTASKSPPTSPSEIGDRGKIVSKQIKEEAAHMAYVVTALDEFNSLLGMMNFVVDPLGDFVNFAVEQIEAPIEARVPALFEEIANDPPARHYRQIVRLRRLRVPPLPTSSRLGRTKAQALTALLRAEGLVASCGEATLLAFERFTGAERAHDTRWEQVQLRSLVPYSSCFAAALLSEAQRLPAAEHARQAFGGSRTITSSELAAARRKVARHGLPSRVRRELSSAGITVKRQQELVTRFLHGRAGAGTTPVAKPTDASNLTALRTLAGATLLLHREAVEGLTRLQPTRARPKP